MDLEKGDKVMLHDKHSKFDGKVGEITSISTTMFGDCRYSIDFIDEKKHGVPETAIETLEHLDDI